MIRLLFALCLVTVVAAPATSMKLAHAEDAAERTAKRHYDRGKKLFELQKFEEALEQFQKAYDASPIPDFLFNIGQCQRNLGDYEAAIFSFKRFLKLDPETDKREKVEELIEELQRKIDEGSTDRLQLRDKRRRKPEPVETGDRPVYKKWWFWTGIALVGAGAGVGIYLATRTDAPATDLGNIEFRR